MMPASFTNHHFKAGTFGAFIVVGGLATVLHWALAACLLAMTTVPAVLASTIGFVVSAGCNFLANARFTFGAAAPTRSGAMRFAAVAASGCLWNALVLQGGLLAGLPVVLAQAAATLAVLLWNFSLSAGWVFRPGADAA